MFTEPSQGCWSSGQRNISMYQVSSSTVFFFVSYMHIHVHFIMYCAVLFSIIVYILSNMTLFIGSQSFNSLTSFSALDIRVETEREEGEEEEF